MPAAVTITDDHREWDRVIASLRREHVIEVGVLGSKAGVTHEGGPTMADVATSHEFGGVSASGRPNPPRRSFVAGWVDEARDKIARLLAVVQKAAIDGEINAGQAANQIGARMVGEMQRRISAGIAPALAPSTLERKGGKTTPLILTGQLRRSITWRVDGVEGAGG